MRQPRLKAAADCPVGFYHCTSRVVDRRFALKSDIEKQFFVSLMREYAAFCEVEVLTHCIMDNHFHILLAVPRRPDILPDAEAMVVKVQKLSGHQGAEGLRQRLEMYRQAGDWAGQAQLLARYHARMWDVSVFMKLVKQRFTQGYNRRHKRKGTLWEQRFRSVLVEGAGTALAAVAIYIDLNPLRARKVADPKDYRWSGYGAAVAGDKEAQSGLQTVVGAMQGGRQESPSQSLEIYRTQLYRSGHEQRESVGEDGRTERGAFEHQEVLKVLAAKGRLPLASYVRCRVRYFTDGAVLGSREFVNGTFDKNRSRFGVKRTSGARRLRGLQEQLYTLRDLRLAVFG